MDNLFPRACLLDWAVITWKLSEHASLVYLSLRLRRENAAGISALESVGLMRAHQQQPAQGF